MGRVGSTLIVLGLLGALASCSSSNSDSALPPAVWAPGTFAVVADRSGSLSISVEGELKPVDYRGPEASEYFGNDIGVAIDDERVAVIHAGRLVLIERDGTAMGVVCEDCESVTWNGDKIVVQRPSLSEGRAFDIATYSLELKQADRRTFRQATERSDPGGDQSATGVSLLAAGPDVIWVDYTDRFGFARGGSRTVAAYSLRSGERLGKTHLPGSPYLVSLSHDGRFLAVAYGGSSGACSTVGELDVIDVTSMTVLNTGPRVPAAAKATINPNEGPMFRIEDLRWSGHTVVATGKVYLGWGDADCDPGTTWRRQFDSGTGVMRDQPADELPNETYLGGACANVVSRDRPLPEGFRVIFAPQRPDECVGLD